MGARTRNEVRRTLFRALHLSMQLPGGLVKGASHLMGSVNHRHRLVRCKAPTSGWYIKALVLPMQNRNHEMATRTPLLPLNPSQRIHNNDRIPRTIKIQQNDSYCYPVWGNMKTNNRIASFLFYIFSAVLLTAFLVVCVFIIAQDLAVRDIENPSLKQNGVPVISVALQGRLPFEIEIALQSTSDNDKLAREDNWAMVLASRAATMGYRYGARPSSYTLNVYNAKGTLISSAQTYIYRRDINQNLSQSTGKILDPKEASEFVARNLDLAGLSLDSLEITPENSPGSAGQVLTLQVSDKDVETVNRSLPRFLSSLFGLLETNQKNGLYIVLCRLTVVDRQGTLLMDYARDVEGGTTQWYQAAGLYNDWHPHPSDTGEPTPALPPYTPVPSATEPATQGF